MAAAKSAANSNKPCPICGQPPQEKFRPFCSPRCADLDLHRWLGEVYRLESDDNSRNEQDGDES